MSVNRYELFFDINWEKPSYKCQEEVFLSSPGELTLNAVDMKINYIEVDGNRSEYLYDGQLLKLGFVKDNAKISFEKDIPDALMGFYRAPYAGGYMLTTHFEPDGARLMFPCQDEPSKKAVFRVKVKVDSGLEAISNMPSERVEDDGDKKLIEFQETPMMSSYLLYLGIGKFDQVEDSLGDVKIYVVAYKGKSVKGRFALDIAKKALQVYSEYLGTSYQLPKLHLIAVPEFAMGAMENWGAITFRETALLADGKSGEAALRGVATTIVHELAHQWFGDLVTMKWWDDLWLNESFATLLSFKVVDKMFPEWEIWNNFLITETSGSLLMDSLSSTHPIHVDVHAENEVEQLFDAISYGKGASVLRMIERYLGEETFRTGLTHYLKKFAYSNANANDFWGSLEEVSGKPVSKIMSAWINKAGHPVINVKRAGGSAVLSQSGFRFLGNWDDSWPIPLVYTSGRIQISQLIYKQAVVPIEKSFKLNADGMGYYRVFYEDWLGALEACKGSYDTWNVVSDIYAHVLQGKVDLLYYLDLIKKFERYQDYLLAWEISSQLANLFSILPEVIRPSSSEYHSNQVDVWSGKGGNANYLLDILSRRLSLVSEEYGKKLLLQGYFPADPDIKAAVAIAYGLYSREPFNELMALYSNAQDEDRPKILTGMMAIKDPIDFRRALEFLMSPNVRKQDVRYLITASNNVYNKEIAWEWFKENLPAIRKIYSSSGVLPGMIASLIPYIGIGREEDVRTFFKEKDIPEASTGIKSGLELLAVYSRLSASILKN